MPCSQKLHIDGLVFSVCLGVCSYKCIALNIEDPKTRRAVLSKDSHVLDVLAETFAEIEDIIAPMELDAIDWEYNCDEDEFAAVAQRALQSAYASTEDKMRAKDALRRLAKYRHQITQRRAKLFYMQQRRGEFAKEQARLMLALIDRDGYHCAACGSTERLGIDHILPLSKGGSDDLDNLKLLCPSCNSKKGDSAQ